MRNSRENSEGREGEGGAGATLQPWRTLRWSGWVLPDRNCRLRGAHAGAGEKWEREGAAERNCYVQTVIPSKDPCAAWGVEESGGKE